MKKIIIMLIRAYQVFPFSGHSACRFSPTCSEYMLEAIDLYGIKNGIKLGLKRIKRCHNHGEFGYDPVPKMEDYIEKK